MANIMSLKSIFNKPSRNGFDLTQKFNYTAKAGEILPAAWWFTIPGDHFEIDLSSFTRTMPLNTAAFARCREYYDFYFVPIHMIWNKFPQVVTQMLENNHHAMGLLPKDNYALSGDFPYVTCEQIANYIHSLVVLQPTDVYKKNYLGFDRATLLVKLLDYLGYPDFSAYLDQSVTWSTQPMSENSMLNLFPIMAYQKIYFDWFRFTQWEKSAAYCFNMDYVKGTNDLNIDISSTDFLRDYNFFDLRYCNFDKDLFFGLIPQPQYGDQSVAMLSGHFIAGGSGTQKNGYINFTNSPIQGTNSQVSIDMNLNSDSSAGVNIIALRQAEFLQKWKEVAGAAPEDYKSQLKAHWNVDASEYQSGLCRCVGGFVAGLDIGEVINNNITGSNDAAIAGKGTFNAQGNKFTFDSKDEYGILMCVSHKLPTVDYTTSVVNPEVYKVHDTDIAIPEMDSVGMQQIPMSWLMNDAQPQSIYLKNTKFLGWAPRYIEYKTSVDRSVGAFRTTLAPWVLNFSRDDLIRALSTSGKWTSNVMSYTFFKVDPSIMNDLFGFDCDSTVDTDQFYSQTLFKVTAVRNLDKNGLPY